VRVDEADSAHRPYSRAHADALKQRAFDRAALAARPLPYEKLDQLVVDLLLGVR
jgi:xylose isomerase